MDVLHERSILGAIECHELLGEYDMARYLRSKFNSDKERKQQQKENKIMIQKNQVFEGTLVAAGWDKLDYVIQSSLYTQDDEDILLEHHSGMRKFTPFLNQKVRLWGDIISTTRDGRKVLVKKINKLLGGFTKPVIPLRDEFDDLINPITV